MLIRFSTGGNQKKYTTSWASCCCSQNGAYSLGTGLSNLMFNHIMECWQSLLTYKSVLTSVLARLFFLLTFSSCSPSFVALAQCSNIAMAFSHDGTVGPEKPVCLKPRSDIPVDCGNFHRKFCIVQHVERHTVVSSLAEVPLGLVCQDCNPTR